MHSVTTLSSRYRELQELFVTKLGVGDATASDVVEELCGLSGQSDKRAAIKALLSSLSGFIKAGRFDDSLLAKMTDAQLKIFPMRGARCDLMSMTDGDWLIPDRERIARSFGSDVAFLDFDLPTQRRLEPLISKLGLQGRLLSKNYSEETSIAGDSCLHMESTMWLRAKAILLAR